MEYVRGVFHSLILFCGYLDELILRRQQKGTGCWIGQHFYGSLAYADDLTLLSPTVLGLKSFLSVCEDYGHEYGMSYNPTKSHCVLFSRKRRIPPELTLNGQTLKWDKQAKHLGNVISSDLDEHQDVRHKRSDLVGRVNSVSGNLYELSNDIIMKMFSSQCCHYYGTQTWQFSTSTVGHFRTMWNRCVRRLLNLPNRTHCRFLLHLANIRSPVDQICGSFLKLLSTMENSDNDSIKYLADIGTKDARSIIGGNLNFISEFYKCSVNAFKMKTKYSISMTECSNVDSATVQAIKDAMSGKLEHFFNLNELSEFMNSLCVN